MRPISSDKIHPPMVLHENIQYSLRVKLYKKNWWGILFSYFCLPLASKKIIFLQAPFLDLISVHVWENQ